MLTKQFAGDAVATFVTKAATSSEAMGCRCAGDRRTVSPSVADWAMAPRNSKNWVERMIV
ncbi:hypothetical protein D3C83_169440 [compost metagenome]